MGTADGARGSTGGPPLEERSTLATAVSTITETDRGVWRFLAELYDGLERAVAAAIREEPNISEQVRQADLIAKSLPRTYEAKWGRLPAPRSGSNSHGNISEWLKAAEALQNEMLVAKVPLRNSKQEEQRRHYAPRMNALLAGLPMVERMTLEQAFRSFPASARSAASRAFADVRDDLSSKLAAVPSLPPVLGSLVAGSMDPGPVPGLGDLAFSIGSACLGPLTLKLQPPGRLGLEPSVESTQVDLPSLAVPIVINLDRDRGVVTNSKATVENTILKLLALLPPGRLRADVFDPLQLGDSARFLFGLDDASTAVIGEKILTTEKELEELLLGLEEHITFVTQKYLASDFDTLTAYNQTAGEIAESYRLLVLYDYPAGFVRPNGHCNDEALTQLGRIVRSGPRCGVFPLVIVSNETGASVDGTVEPLSGLKPFFASQRVPNLQAVTSQEPTDGLSSMIFDPAELRGGADPVGASQAKQTAFVAGAEAEFYFVPDDPAAGDVVDAILVQVQRGIARADDVQVSPQDVARLARARHERDVQFGIAGRTTLPEPSEPSTWWFGDSTEQITADFGRLGASDVASLVFDSRTLSAALVGGRPGSGKSVLLHAILAAFCTRYSPEELELYLVDFKEGVEFKAYAAGSLPHARVVAIEAQREFGISVLEALDAEITRRGALFRSGGGEEVGLIAYRQRTGEKLSRQVLVIDEFHVLFERDDALATRAAELLDRIVRQGRAFGVHSILASQTLAGMSALGKHTLNQIPVRIALQCADADSRLLLGDENPDAQLLTKSGEGIINSANGVRAANQRFQAAFWNVQDRADLVASLASKGEPIGHRRPVVFEGRKPAHVTDLAPETFDRTDGPLKLPLGMPFTLDGPVLVELLREAGANILVIGDDELGTATLTIGLAALALQGASVHVCDFGPPDGPLYEAIEFLSSRQLAKTARGRRAPEIIASLAQEVSSRVGVNDYHARSTVLVLPWLHRARDLDPDFGGEVLDNLEVLLRDGPDVGVHVVAWCDRAASLSRRLTPLAQREFSLRLLGPMSRDDSDRLIDSTAASGLDPSQAVFDDHDRATTFRLRRFEAPPPDWIATIAGKA